jgi:hypothetical protein
VLRINSRSLILGIVSSVFPFDSALDYYSQGLFRYHYIVTFANTFSFVDHLPLSKRIFLLVVIAFAPYIMA